MILRILKLISTCLGSAPARMETLSLAHLGHINLLEDQSQESAAIPSSSKKTADPVETDKGMEETDVGSSTFLPCAKSRIEL